MSTGRRIKHTFRLPPSLSRQLAEFAARKRVSQASVVEAALAALLSPDGPERVDAAFARRLDRIARQLDKLGYHVEVGNEAFSLYVRRWLEVTPIPVIENGAASRAAGEKRYSDFVEALAHRMESSRHLSDDLRRDGVVPSDRGFGP